MKDENEYTVDENDKTVDEDDETVDKNEDTVECVSVFMDPFFVMAKLMYMLA